MQETNAPRNDGATPPGGPSGTPAAKNPREIRVAGSNRVYDRNKLLLVLLVPLAMSLLQVSSVNVALSSMGEALSASDAQKQWVLSGYALAIGISLVPAGRLGDIFGRSGAFVTGLAVFTLASLLVGISNDPTQLNVLRIFQGIGAGIFSPQTTGLIQQYFVGPARARAFALFGLVVAMSVAAGPLMSGALISAFGADVGWRASFLVNVPLGILGIVIALLWLPFGKERRTIGKRAKKVQAEYAASEAAAGREVVEPVKREKREKVDLDPVGMTLLAAAVLGIMLPFMSHGSVWIWALVPTGLLLLGVWVWWENHYKKAGHFPMVDLALFKIRSFSYATAIASIQFLGSTSMFVILAMFLQEGDGVSAIKTALVGLPNAVLSAYAALWAGKRAYAKGAWVQMVALGVILTGILGACVALWAFSNGASFWWLALPLTIMGFGQGAMGSANQTVTMLEVPASHGGTAGGFSQTGQRIATAIGNAVITAVLFAALGSNPTVEDWTRATMISYLVIAAIVSIAMVLAVRFWRTSKNPTAPVPAA